MDLHFSKYQGAGNDFILINDIEGKFPENDHLLIQKMCDRKFGIGADGLMLLRKSKTNDFKMIYFNSDGYEGTMCGNGGRCLVSFSVDSGYLKKRDKIKFDAIDGEHEGKIHENGIISIKMQNVDRVLQAGNGYRVETGSTHHVEYVDNLVDMDVYRHGKTIREGSLYAPAGCNVNFIQPDKQGIIHIRTYERGVENETLSCGTGSVASAIVEHFRGNQRAEYFIKAKGGNLTISFKEVRGIYKNIWLKGPATFVFKGVW